MIHTKDIHPFLSKTPVVKFGGSSFLSYVSYDHNVRLDPGGEILLNSDGEVTSEAPRPHHPSAHPPRRATPDQEVGRLVLKYGVADVCVAGCSGVEE